MYCISCLTCKIFIDTDYFKPDILDDRKWFLITDSNVFEIYSEKILSWNIPFYVISSGEISKNRNTKQKIEDFLLTNNCQKNSGIIGFGGGVISDIVGFTASTYMRGIRFVLVPTTVLAIVDSTIGGKNAVDTVFGKNLIGTIYRPESVYIDLIFLQSLPSEMWSAGMAEVLKMALILSPTLYNILLKHNIKSLRENSEVFQEVVIQSIELKKKIVEQDENESQLRMILNFGHTIGHAIESELNDLNHGFCVSIGMYIELEIANFFDSTSINLEEFKEILIQYDLPYKLPNLDQKRLLKRMKLDKKIRNSGIPLFVPSKIGEILPSPLLVPPSILPQFLSNNLFVKGIPNLSEVIIPGSKSLTNRYLLLASLCSEQVVIESALISEDTVLMINCLNTLGLSESSIIEKNKIIVKGGGRLVNNSKNINEIYVGNAGTVARFLAMTCLLLENNTVIRGNERMHQRPIKDLVNAINYMENRAEYLEKEGFLPILIKGGGFEGGVISVDCSQSSQYVSSILMAAPLAKRPCEINLTGKSEPTSLSYIKMTVTVMKIFGAHVEEISELKYIVKNTGYSSPMQLTVEPDATSASYFLALSVLHNQKLRIEGLGTDSLQGEFEFVKILEKIGCEIETSPTSTTLLGLSSLRPISVNMNNCTDSFITLTILLATIPFRSQITGITNQKIKECNRILALQNEFAKLGVEIEEIHDGISIRGQKALIGHKKINTYGDHRIAMTFAILATAVNGLVIKDKNVVNKTFPEFWKILSKCGVELNSETHENNIQRKFSNRNEFTNAFEFFALDRKKIIKNENPDLREIEISAIIRKEWENLDDSVKDKYFEIQRENVLGKNKIKGNLNPQRWVNEDFLSQNEEVLNIDVNQGKINSILLIGMRGAGKSSLGRALAEELQWELLDLDDFIAQQLETTSLASYIEKKGISAFRDLEYEAIRQVLFRKNCVIVTGGGSLEHPQIFLLIKAFFPVIWISTSIQNIRNNLSEQESSHRINLNIETTYESRKRLYQNTHDYRFFYKSREISKVSENFKCFVYRILGEKAPVPTDFTYFCCITNAGSLSLIQNLQGVTAVEIRADLFSSLKKSLKTLSEVKEILPGLQSIFTYRSDKTDKNYWKILKKTLQWNPDFIDIQFEFNANWSERYYKIKQKLKHSRIILSYHSTKNEKNLENFYEKMKDLKPDILKFITPLKVSDKSIPLICFEMGEENCVTRVQNTYFSPVKVEESLAKGQFTYNELSNFQEILNLKPKQFKFYLAGNNITKSPGPGLYNSLFSDYGLNYSYDLLETNEISVVLNVLHSRTCLGMSITIPFKEEIVKYLHKISKKCKLIGSVNTVIKRKGQLIGYNTDWQGFFYPLTKFQNNFKKAGVLGAGGTCKSAVFALEQLGINEITVWNRSAKRLFSLQTNKKIATTTEISNLNGIDLIINTLPGNAEISLDWINANSIVYQAAYFPPITYIGKNVIDKGGVLLTGKDMYLHMARFQFMLFTGRNISVAKIFSSLKFSWPF